MSSSLSVASQIPSLSWSAVSASGTVDFIDVRMSSLSSSGSTASSIPSLSWSRENRCHFVHVVSVVNAIVIDVEVHSIGDTVVIVVVDVGVRIGVVHFFSVVVPSPSSSSLRCHQFLIVVIHRVLVNGARNAVVVIVVVNIVRMPSPSLSFSPFSAWLSSCWLCWSVCCPCWPC